MTDKTIDAYLKLQELKPDLEDLIHHADEYCEQISLSPVEQNSLLQGFIRDKKKKIAEMDDYMPYLLHSQSRILTEARSKLDLLSLSLGEKYSYYKKIESLIDETIRQWHDISGELIKDKLKIRFFELVEEYSPIRFINHELIPIGLGSSPNQFYLEASHLSSFHTDAGIHRYEQQYLQAETLSELEKVKENISDDLKTHESAVNQLKNRWLGKKYPRCYQIIKSPIDKKINLILARIDELIKNPDDFRIIEQLSQKSREINQRARDIDNFSLSESYLGFITSSEIYNHFISFNSYPDSEIGSVTKKEIMKEHLKPYYHQYESACSLLESKKLHARKIFSEELDRIIQQYESKEIDITQDPEQQIKFLYKMIGYASSISLLSQESRLFGIRSQIEAYAKSSPATKSYSKMSIERLDPEGERESKDNNPDKLKMDNPINTYDHINDTKLNSGPICGAEVISTAYSGLKEASNPEIVSYCQRVVGFVAPKMNSESLKERIRSAPDFNESWSESDKHLYLKIKSFIEH